MPEGITAKTRLLGVMGWPVEHSKSPLMQGAALRAAGLDYAYVAMPVTPDRVEEAVRGLRALGFRGCNVTIPHKVSVLKEMDELTETAAGVGAVNTIRIEEDGRLTGHNTDADGALDAVEQETGVSAEDAHVVVIGAGGAARGSVYGAAKRGAAKITLVNRTKSRAEELTAEMQRHFPSIEFHVPQSVEADTLSDARIVLQMTSLGMKDGHPLPIDPALLPADCVALEAVYAPLQTRWKTACEERGIRTIDGLAMLVAQGALSFEYWTGVAPDREVMRRALMDG